MTNNQAVEQRIASIELQLLLSPRLVQADIAAIMEITAIARKAIGATPPAPEPRDPPPPFSHWRLA